MTHTYETVVAYVSEAYFLGHEKPEDSDITTLLAFIYNKDELRVIHDINQFLTRREVCIQRGEN